MRKIFIFVFGLFLQILPWIIFGLYMFLKLSDMDSPEIREIVSLVSESDDAAVFVAFSGAIAGLSVVVLIDTLRYILSGGFMKKIWMNFKKQSFPAKLITIVCLLVFIIPAICVAFDLTGFEEYYGGFLSGIGFSFLMLIFVGCSGLLDDDSESPEESGEK